MSKTDRALLAQPTSSVHDDTDDESEDSEDDLSSVSSNEECNDGQTQGNNSPQGEANKTMQHGDATGHRMVHLPSLCQKISSFCVCRSCLQENIPQVAEDLVKIIVSDVIEAGTDIRKENFVNQLLEKKTQNMLHTFWTNFVSL